MCCFNKYSDVYVFHFAQQLEKKDKLMKKKTSTTEKVENVEVKCIYM